VGNPTRRAPGRPKHSEGVASVETIVAAAARLFLTHGYEAVSLTAVAAEAGLTKATIYYYFATKAEVFVAAMEHWLGRIAEETARILSAPAPLAERVRHLTRVRLQISDMPFDFEHVLREAEPRLTAGQTQRVRQALQRVTDVLVAAFAAAGAEVAAPEAVFAAHAYLALLNVAFARDAAGRRLFTDADRTADWIVALMTRSPGPSGTGSPPVPRR